MTLRMKIVRAINYLSECVTKHQKEHALSLTKYNLQNLCKNSKSPGIIVRSRISVNKKKTL